MGKDTGSVWKKYEDNKISHSAIHYLFAIKELLEKNGYARMIDISKKLKITPWSCSTGIKSLLKKWFIVEDTNKFVQLSKTGTSIINEVLGNRETLYNFFKNTLKVSDEKSLINACKIEHLIGSEVIEKMKKFS